MKFKNRTTGELLSPGEVYRKCCESTKDCSHCSLDSSNNGTGQNCAEYALDHIAQIADKMGYDPIPGAPASSSPVDGTPITQDDAPTESTDTPTDNADTPTTEPPAPSPIAQLLGVLDDEPFRVPGLGGWFRVHKGERQTLSRGTWTRCYSEAELIRILSAKDSLIHLPLLTEPELAILKPIPNAKWISRDVGDATIGVGIWAIEPLCDAVGGYYSVDKKDCLSWFISDLFPSIRPGDCFSLEDVL